MGITNLSNINFNKIFEEEFINIKRLDRGIKAIFVPHSPGVYVSISLGISNMEQNLTNENNQEVNKYYKCNAILNLDCVDSELKELLMYIIKFNST
jgi:hypothetical protein